MRKQQLTLLALIVSLSSACMSIDSAYDRSRFGDNPYEKDPFYARYLRQDNNLDRQIRQRLDYLKGEPSSARMHNELGSLLVHKGFPKDAAREFKRAIASDNEFYPAWYNLALLQQAGGDEAGSLRSLRKTVDLKPGHPSAHFQIGLVYEKKGKKDEAVEHYAKAIAINQSILDVRSNPRVLDSELLDLALLRLYPQGHSMKSMQFQGAPRDYVDPSQRESVSPQAEPADIVTPVAPTTEQATQQQPPTAPAATPTPAPGP